MNDFDLRYPIGKFEKPTLITPKIISDWIKTIELFPANLVKEISGLSENELKLTYREYGWNIKQIVHHCADSHMHSFIRFKLALTEDNPTIKPYFEDRWAELNDVVEAPIKNSLQIIEGLHKRWIVLLSTMNKEQFERTFFHPGSNKKVSLKENLGIYAWHCNHHLGHIRLAKKSKT
ncbi:MAG: putative metal-dependent hydrolase [Ignavibacteriae bacterium]|nr:putative metal-dependent hydrolase [Ignavibacteriota bacterium]MCB9207435.1 putative metal-dependent hydrolase [Ignavibacteriales bacterium]MCB9220061.1 putative metal-dependent hydrolase [Ignavibacteriales bacterium]